MGTGAADTTPGQYPKVLAVRVGSPTGVDRSQQDANIDGSQQDADYADFAVASGASSLPTDVRLTLVFSQEMAPAEVHKSTLLITDVSHADYNFEIEIQTAMSQGWVGVSWNDPANTEATLTFGSYDSQAFELAAGNEYKLQMVDNQAQGANGLPLILGGTIDLLSGFEFRVNNAPTITQVKDGDGATIAVVDGKHQVVLD